MYQQRVSFLKVAFVVLVFFSGKILSAQKVDTSGGSQSHNSMGFLLNIGGQSWSQKNLNAVLTANNLPNARDLTFMAGFEGFHRMDRFEYSIESQLQSGRKKGTTDKTSQSFAAGILSFRLHFTDARNTFYPLIGVGYLTGKTEVTSRKGPTTLNTVLNSRNTASLYNRQGFASFGGGVRMFPDKTSHFIQVEAGYRVGFAASNWSTDEESTDYMVNSTTDRLGQVFLKIGIGIERKKQF